MRCFVVLSALFFLLLPACGGSTGGGGDAGAVADGDATLLDEGAQSPDVLDGASADVQADATVDAGNEACSAGPCGGDVVGNWAYSRLCEAEVTPVAIPSTACPGQTLTSVFYAEGGIEFRVDGTATITRSIVEVTEAYMPFVCSGDNCELMHGFDECAVGSDGCTCTKTSKQPAEPAEDSWSTTGTTLTTGGPDDPSDVEYCVTGDLLKLIHLDPPSETYLTRD